MSLSARCPEGRKHRGHLFDRAILAPRLVDVLLQVVRANRDLSLVDCGLEASLIRLLFLCVNERRFGEIAFDVHSRGAHEIRFVATILDRQGIQHHLSDSIPDLSRNSRDQMLNRTRDLHAETLLPDEFVDAGEPDFGGFKLHPVGWFLTVNLDDSEHADANSV